jgi:GNAT superfamily N-acetyltransferase
MLRTKRNQLKVDNWILDQVDSKCDVEILSSFDCGDSDLNEYFQKESLLNKSALVGQPYFLYDATVDKIVPVALIDLCNDSIRKEGSKRQPGYLKVADIEEGKQFTFLPAVKITRFGVNKPFQRLNIGSHALNMVKTLFITENRTGCRFITVDAYNKTEVKNFYQKNDFKFFYDKDENKHTRSMFFDLKRLILPGIEENQDA